jgi:phosphoribosyl 1,2-cyclic phosphate phosphodiesterase
MNQKRGGEIDMKITILGCGSSVGVPSIVGNWGACNPDQPKNRRSRTSLALSIGDNTWLIDTSPDIRSQCLREQITKIDGVIYTHGHFDHTGGLSDLKPFSFATQSPIPIWADSDTLKSLKETYPYAFQDLNTQSPTSSYRPFIKSHIIDGPFELSSVPVLPFIQDHRYSLSLGFRFPTWAYSTDVWAFDDEAFRVLSGIELWIVDCMSYKPSATHSHVERTLSWIDRVKPHTAILIHMGHELDYDTLCADLPSHVIPAFDGMVVQIPI